MKRRVANGVEIGAVEARLFQELTREALRVTGAVRTCIAVYDDTARAMRLAAVAGAAWTPAKRKTLFKLKDHRVPADNPQLLGDLVLGKQYRTIFPPSSSKAAFSVYPLFATWAKFYLGVEWTAELAEARQSNLQVLIVEASLVLQRLAMLKDSWLIELRGLLHSATAVAALCNGALKHIRKIFGVTGCSIFLANPGGDELRLVATTKRGVRMADVPPYSLGEGLTGWVAQHRTVLRLRNIDDQRELSSIPGLKRRKAKWSEVNIKGPKRFLGAPLLAQDSFVGVVRLATKHNDDDFNASDELLIQSVAGRLALAIQSLWLKEQQDALSGLSGRLAEAPSLQKVGEAILDQAIRTLGGQFGHIRFFHASERTLEMLAVRGPRGNGLPRFRRVGEGLAGLVAQTRKPHLVQDLSKDKRFQQILEKQKDLRIRKSLGSIRSVACFPLTVRDDLVGTLTVESKRKYAFGPNQVHYLSELNRRLAAALSFALILTRLRDMGMQFSRTLDLDTLLPNVLSAASSETQFESGTLRILDKARKFWVLKAAEGVNPGVLSDLPFRDDLLKRAATENRALRVFEARRDKEFQDFVSSVPSARHRAYLRSIRSFLIVPINLKELYIGFIFLGSTTEHYDVPGHKVDFLQILAAEAAIAISNAQLYTDLEEILRMRPLAILGRASAGTAHRLRHGLQKVLIHLPSATSAGTDLAVSRKVQAARLELQTLVKLINDLERAHMEVRESVDVVEAVQNAIADTESEFGEGVACRVSVPTRTAVTYGHRLQIELAFQMLILNAAEAMPTGGRLTVGIAVTSHNIEVFFRDTGTGMNDQVLSKIRHGDVITTKGHGGGYGLAIVFDVIDRHLGQIRFASDPGKGTTVTVTLIRAKDQDHA